MKFIPMWIRLVFVVLVIIAFDGLFIVNQINQAIVLRFGEFMRLHDTPGLKFKVPFVEDVLMYETRILDYDLPPIYVTTEDQKRLIVDTYTRYRIANPLKFFKAVKPASEVGARLRLEAVISSSVRNVMGKVPLRNMLTDERSKVMKQILKEIRDIAEPLGIVVVDLRIIRSELPVENRDAVFARMNSELILFAKENRAKGEEAALAIKAQADKEKTILLADANNQALQIRGKGEAEAVTIAAEAFGIDAEFYQFYRSLEAYKKSMKPGTNYLLSTNNSFSKYLTEPQSK